MSGEAASCCCGYVSIDKLGIMTPPFQLGLSTLDVGGPHLGSLEKMPVWPRESDLHRANFEGRNVVDPLVRPKSPPGYSERPPSPCGDKPGCEHEKPYPVVVSRNGTALHREPKCPDGTTHEEEYRAIHDQRANRNGGPNAEAVAHDVYRNVCRTQRKLFWRLCTNLGIGSSPTCCRALISSCHVRVSTGYKSGRQTT